MPFCPPFADWCQQVIALHPDECGILTAKGEGRLTPKVEPYRNRERQTPLLLSPRKVQTAEAVRVLPLLWRRSGANGASPLHLTGSLRQIQPLCGFFCRAGIRVKPESGQNALPALLIACWLACAASRNCRSGSVVLSGEVCRTGGSGAGAGFVGTGEREFPLDTRYEGTGSAPVQT